MGFRPDVIAYDYETALTSGEASTEYYRDDFRVASCAFSWRTKDGSIKSIYREGEEAVAGFLKKVAEERIPLVAHNYTFEYGVTMCRFPWFPRDELIQFDTMRMVQVADNGGKEGQRKDPSEMSIDEELAYIEGRLKPPRSGLGLESAISRWLPIEVHDHKAPFYKYLREECGVRKGKEGANLHLLPPDMLERYNVADTELTLRLYERLKGYFEEIGYDWSMDHWLYKSSAKLIAKSKVRGVPVNRRSLTDYRETVLAEMDDIKTGFRDRFESVIAELEQEYLEKYVHSRKSGKGKMAAWERAIEQPELIKFNVGSTKQLQDLFVRKLGFEPKFKTEKGSPSFKSSFLSQYGEGGEMLKKRRTRLIVLKQSEKLLEKSEYDGRYHIDLKAAGTTTGRFAGSGGLNVQGLSRKDKGLMSAIVADPGKTIVSADLSAGEPTCTTHFSRDPNYYAATFGMVGKEPHYNDTGVLQIDDIYLMTMSVSPIGRDKMREVFNTRFKSVSFADQWLEDPDVIKDQIKDERALHKILVLGLGYSMGPKKLVTSAYEKGYTIDYKTAKKFYKAYWELFKEVGKLATNLERKFKREGAITNPFGYRLIPDPSYKAFNYFIQSSVSGIIHCLCAKFFAAFPEAEFHTVIHDELLASVPTDRLVEAEKAWYRSVESLNNDLNWSVKIRSGWVPGKDFYEAH